MLHLRAASLADTRAIAAALASVVRVGDVVVLAGEMGAGKTAFAQGFGAALGVAEPMTSPTFTLVHSYRTSGKVMLHHADIYRLSTHHEVADLALGELLEYDGIVLVEWGDVVAASFGEHLLVRLDHDEVDEDVRHLTISGSGRSWAMRWERVAAGPARFVETRRQRGPHPQ
ncbi:MAG: tRNA (adenosine(37)-N6)-threonylcarbamoyltransferase complex ATPase subunit type 1 TsaE, partial [Ilumatobacteraceae bacterium]